METLALFGLILAVTGVIVLIIAGIFIIFEMRNDRYAKQVSNAELLLAKERERIALRLHRSYLRKLFSEDDKLIYKDEVLDHLVNVLQIYGADTPKPLDSCPSAEGV